LAAAPRRAASSRPELALAVLVQPELAPAAGGIARVEDGGVRVTAVAATRARC
jgi:hypothetical protein